MTKRHFRIAVAAGLLLTGLAGAAHAQYVWLDEKGRKQYSDMPPPASVPDSRIVKHPGMRPRTEPVAAASKEDVVPAPAPTLAERDAEFRKRRAEREEQEKKAAEEARVAAENKKRCEQVRDYQRALASGERIVRRDKNGEQQFIGDEERARELRDAKRMLEDCK